MSEKVILILVDGMRPDGMMQCGNEFAQELVSKSTYCLKARTVMPSVTLPCHMSLFHSVDPDRHGITTNGYVPQVRPIKGMFDQFDNYDKKCAFFYTWEELRDLGRPDHLHTALCIQPFALISISRLIQILKSPMRQLNISMKRLPISFSFILVKPMRLAVTIAVG